MSSENPVIRTMKIEKNKWARSTIVYGTINVCFRIYLITASGLVAAGKTLGIDNSPTQLLVGWIPILAVTVTIVAGLDAWLKPRDRWRGFMQDRDDLEDLINQGLAGESTETPALLDLNSKFRELRRRHVERNVF